MTQIKIPAGQATAPTTTTGAAAGGRLFSRSLYADTLRRLRLTGLLLTLACLLITLSQLLPYLYGERSPHYNRLYLNPEVFGNIPMFFALLSPAVLMMQTFFFLYRRSGSDLYHGLPCTRRCLGISLAAASLTWSCAAVTLPLAVCAALIPLSPLPFPMALLGWMLAHHLTVITLVTGCALIGASLSGTPLAGVVIAGMALFLPRWALTVYRYFFVNVSGMMIYNDAGRLLSPALHLPTADLVLLTRGYDLPRFLGKTYAQFFQNGPGILYTLALGAAALAVGLCCFVRRKSELAGQALARSRSRYALHAAAALTALLWASYFLYRGYKGYRGDWLTASAPIWGPAVAAAFALYLALQRLRAKSWREPLRAAPITALAVVCAAAVCWGGGAAGRSARAGLPGAAEIASVSFPCEPGDNSVFFALHRGQNLFATQVSGVRYDKPEIRELAAAAMAEHAVAMDEYEASRLEYLPGGQQVTVEVALTGGGTLRRTVPLPERRIDLLKQLTLASPDFIRALRWTAESPTLVIESLESALLSDDDDTAALWQTFRTELDALNDPDFVRHTWLRYSLPRTMNDDDPADYPGHLMAHAWHGLDLCDASFGIGQNTTPGTWDAYVLAASRRFGGAYRAALDAAVALGFERERVQYSVNFAYMSGSNGHATRRNANFNPLIPWSERHEYDFAGETPPDREAYEAHRLEEEQTVREILRRSPPAEDGRGPIVTAHINATPRRDGGVYEPLHGSAYLQVSEADFAALTELAQRRARLGIQW